MTAAADPWTLPGLVRWLNNVVQLLGNGLAVLPADSSRPPAVLDALRGHLLLHPVTVARTPGCAPAEALADAFGTAPTLESLLSPALGQDVGIVVMDGLGPEDLSNWSVFLGRFAAARATGRPGPALLVFNSPLGLDAPVGAFPPNWRASMRRGDRVIWAEEHMPVSRDGLAGDFAVVLAVELCAWRLDLAAALMQAGLDDLAAPVDWLSRRLETPIFGVEPPCPLACLTEKKLGELQQRIWKAQLAALFPALENWRLETVARHRQRLQLDDHLRSLGVDSVEELELGALRFQLRRHLTRQEAERLEMLARARNALAHRQPVNPDDALKMFRA